MAETTDELPSPHQLVAGLNSQSKNRNGNDIATSKIETNRSIDLSIPSIPCIMSVPSGLLENPCPKWIFQAVKILELYTIYIYRRKFRSQTSDNMDR